MKGSDEHIQKVRMVFPAISTSSKEENCFVKVSKKGKIYIIEPVRCTISAYARYANHTYHVLQDQIKVKKDGSEFILKLRWMKITVTYINEYGRQNAEVNYCPGTKSQIDPYRLLLQSAFHSISLEPTGQDKPSLEISIDSNGNATATPINSIVRSYFVNSQNDGFVRTQVQEENGIVTAIRTVQGMEPVKLSLSTKKPLPALETIAKKP